MRTFNLARAQPSRLVLCYPVINCVGVDFIIRQTPQDEGLKSPRYRIEISLLQINIEISMVQISLSHTHTLSLSDLPRDNALGREPGWVFCRSTEQLQERAERCACVRVWGPEFKACDLSQG
jgi:hypothetical protein